jgi:hypothetical protein
MIGAVTGVWSDDEAESRNQQLLAEVQRLRETIADTWAETQLIHALHCIPRRGVFENEVAISNSASISSDSSASQPQQQCVLQRLLQMPMRTLNRAILMRNTAIVPGRCHIVVTHQRLIAKREILLGVAVQVAECCRETVAAMLARRVNKRPRLTPSWLVKSIA